MQHRGQPRLPVGNERAGRPWAALGALLAVLLAGLVAVPGCLNPRPEEDPSALELESPSDSPGVDNAPEASAPPRETCDDNELLAGCEAPSPAYPDALPPASDEPSANPADAGAPSTADAGVTDAGAPGSRGSSVAE